MPDSKLLQIQPPQEYFATELRTALSHQNISVTPSSFQYLVDLLVRHIDSESFFTKTEDGRLERPVLAKLYEEYVTCGEDRRRHILRRLGDICLMISGFFSDSLKRKVVDLDYYLGVGGSAYLQLSHAEPAQSIVYRDLSTRFREFSSALGEISERAGLQSNSDLLRLYERWLYTGDERLKNLLSENGIHAPLNIDTKNKQ